MILEYANASAVLHNYSVYMAEFAGIHHYSTLILTLQPNLYTGGGILQQSFPAIFAQYRKRIRSLYFKRRMQPYANLFAIQ